MKISQKRSIYSIRAMMVFVLAACGSSEKDGLSDARELDNTEWTTPSQEPEFEEGNSGIREQKKQEGQFQETKFGGVP